MIWKFRLKFKSSTLTVQINPCFNAGTIIRYGKTEIPNPLMTALTSAVVLMASPCRDNVDTGLCGHTVKKLLVYRCLFRVGGNVVFEILPMTHFVLVPNLFRKCI